jgi:hypothetical protein
MTTSSFFKKVKYQWETDVEPILEDVYECITAIIEKKGTPSIFRKCEPVDLYTQIYEMTTNIEFDFCHIDFLYNQEIDAFVRFCERFRIRSLSEMNRHIFGFKILMKWFNCFFHHLNRLRCRAYYNARMVEDDIIQSIQKHYIEPQKEFISYLICQKWGQIRKNNYATDPTLFESMNLIYCFHHQFYNEVFSIYFNHLQVYARHKSDEWVSDKNSLVYMEKSNQCFHEEKIMFHKYFTKYEELPQIYTILKKEFIFPYARNLLQDATHGWKALLRTKHLPNIQTAYNYFYWMDTPTQWVELYQEFLEENIGPLSVAELSYFLKDQTNLLESVFTDDKLRVCFINTLDKTIQKKISNNQQLVIQIAKTIHHNITKKSSKEFLIDLSGLVGFCPEKEVFYENYHYFLKNRLLMGKFHIHLEKMMLDILCSKLGVSFVLNLRLMLEEIQTNYVSNKNCTMNKLSGVIWKLEKDKPLKYEIPHSIRRNLMRLYTHIPKKSKKSSIKLELLWFQGVVALHRGGTDFYMTPIQAIVLMALENPSTHQKLVGKLQIDDDENHNLGGVIESLSKAMLIVQTPGGEWYWNTEKKYATINVIVPPVKSKKRNTSDENDTIHPFIIEAFIVKTLKREKTMTSFHLLDIVSKAYEKIRLVSIKKIVETLIDREYLSKDNDRNELSYVP